MPRAGLAYPSQLTSTFLTTLAGSSRQGRAAASMETQMALIFQRLARNFIKAGYFPTDEATLAGILRLLDTDAGQLRIIDPCCGEGVALAEAKAHLEDLGARVEALGVEFDRERAWHAKDLLDAVIHSDIHDVVIGPRTASLLFLNPPYGDAVSDKVQTGDRAKADRLEKIFFRSTIRSLQYGGVLVLIVPHYVIDEEFATAIARGFEQVRYYRAPEQRFRQCVIFGVRRRSDRPDQGIKAALLAAARGEADVTTLDENCADVPYLVPQAPADAKRKFHAVRIDAPQLISELRRLQRHTLWSQFATRFGQTGLSVRPPLKALRQWHLALALAAGQISGVVTAKSGRTLLVKGDTIKSQQRSVKFIEEADGGITEETTMTDVFVPAIRGIDLTPGPSYGAIVTIR